MGDEHEPHAGESGHAGYGGEHHPLSLFDRLGEQVQQNLPGDLLQRDPAAIRRLVPFLDVLLRWYDPEVRGFEHLPATGPYLVVGNHSGGIYMPDYWAFLRHWLRERGADDPIYSLGFDFLYAIPGVRTLARQLGTVPASRDNAARLLRAGMPVLVYPGGDEDDYRPWTERNHVDLHGRTGFVQLALRHGVPVVPMVSHGSHDVIVVLTRGDALARRLGFDRLRINVMPVVAGPPWGIAPVQLPTWPLPSTVTVKIGEPIDWRHHGAAAADDPAVVRRCYDEVVGRMQADLDGLAAALPHPVLARVGRALGLDRLAPPRPQATT